jgi:hypothetical protein
LSEPARRGDELTAQRDAYRGIRAFATNVASGHARHLHEFVKPAARTIISSPRVTFAAAVKILAMETARFRDIYNRIRPHQALDDATPRQAYLAT